MSGPAGSIRCERLPGEVDLLRLAAAHEGFSQVLTVRGWAVALHSPLALVTTLDEMSQWAERISWRGPSGPGLPPFTGGLAGFLTDDLSPSLLQLDPADKRPSLASLPPIAFGLYDTAVCRAPDGSTWAVAAELPGVSASSAEDRVRQARDAALAIRPAAPAAEPMSGLATSSLSAREHAEALEQIREWIAAGDLYQLNLTAQFSAPWPHGGEALARRLWAASPHAPHAAWLRAPGGAEIISVSPETFLRTDGDWALIRPIKGTRPRREEQRADEAQRFELAHSAKDHAEHVMIVDLERNDLGRVAVPGTVEVPELATVEAHPTVWHLTSTVRARLRPDVRLDELLTAAFPCGSVTGAPKRMAVERIRLLEPVRRGVYCGAIGLVSAGLVDLSVAIRTAVVQDGQAHYGAGGGIVADSDPRAEWEEVLHKAAAFFAATRARLS